MEQVISILNTIATNIPWDLVIASGILSPLLVIIKKWMHIQSEKVMMSLVLLFGVLGAAATYLLTVETADPSIIAVQGLMIAAMSQPIFFILVKPAATWLSVEFAKARAWDAEVKSAAVPSGGLPTQQV